MAAAIAKIVAEKIGVSFLAIYSPSKYLMVVSIIPLPKKTKTGKMKLVGLIFKPSCFFIEAKYTAARAKIIPIILKTPRLSL